jgi:type VI secretion system protein ImpC
MMSESKSAAAAAAAPATTEAPSLLDQILATAKRGVEPTRAEEAGSRTKELVDALVGQAVGKSVVFDKNITRTIEAMVTEIDNQISAQLNEVMHDPKFLRLEGSWRGLMHLVSNTNTGPTLKVKVLSASKTELANDFARETEQTCLYNAIHQDAYNIAGGEPFGALIGDYEWGPGNEDVETLETIAGIARRSFSPFLSAASPAMLELTGWQHLGTTGGFSTIAEGPAFAKWRGFRQTEDASFVALALPRVLARVPYGQASAPVEGFRYEEAALAADGTPLALDHNHFCWMNAAYALGARLTEAFAEYGFCTRIRGLDSGGRVSQLPMYTYKTADGDTATKCPTEVNITDNIDYELGSLGFLPLVHYKNTDQAVFFGAQTVRRPQKYDRDEANANAEISARLPYVMATSRFAHNLKVMGRNMVGSFMEASDCEFQLDKWIKGYVNASADAKEELKARYPLREARVEVVEVPGKPGVYNAVAWLRPWLQMEELTASLRMVAQIPAVKRS